MGRVKLISIIGVLLVACSSPSSSGPQVAPATSIRHFTRLGFATNCNPVVKQENGYDVFGGVIQECLRETYDGSIYESATMTLPDGTSQSTNGIFAYYLAPKAPFGTPVVPPSGLQMIATKGWFSCAGNVKQRDQLPFDCRPYSSTPRVEGWRTFPACWDGTGLLPQDVAYDHVGVCPDGFPKQLPILQMQATWNIADGTGATFSTGGYQDRWTDHWYEPAIDSLVANCIVIPTACGSIYNYFHASPLPK
jgi:hypothetical protein